MEQFEIDLFHNRIGIDGYISNIDSFHNNEYDYIVIDKKSNYESLLIKDNKEKILLI